TPACVQKAPEPRATKPARSLRYLEARVDISNDQIALERHAKPESHDRAVDGGDHRLPIHSAHEQIAGMCVRLLWPAQAPQLCRLPQLPLVDVGAAGEGLAGAAENCDDRLAVLIECRKSAAQSSDEVCIECIALGGTVESDSRYRAIPLIFD